MKGRDVVLDGLKQHGVLASKLHQRTDVYSGFVSSLSNLSNTPGFLDQVLGLPCGWWIDDDDIEKMVLTLRKLTESS